MKTICPIAASPMRLTMNLIYRKAFVTTARNISSFKSEPSEEKSFFLLDAQNSTAVSFFSQYMIYRQQCGTPQEKVTTIPLADIFVLELQETKDASGRITFSYHDPTESAVKNYYFDAPSQFISAGPPSGQSCERNKKLYSKPLPSMPS